VSRRTERIGEQIRAELARLLREEVTDPRVARVTLTLTRVDVSPDLANARVLWSAFAGAGARPGAAGGEPELEGVARGLASAAPFLRRQLARLLPTRRVPELRFEHDPSLSFGARTLSLIAELEHAPKSGREHEPGSEGDGLEAEREDEP